jgi:arylsulfatase A-like enzyme
VKGLARNLLFGLCWVMAIFIVDTVDSYILIHRSTRRIRSDQETATQLQAAVMEFVAQIGVAYLLVGITTGLVLHLVIRTWNPEPVRTRRWLLHAAAICGIPTLIGALWQMNVFPGLYPYFVYRTWFVDNAEPQWWTWLGTAVGMGFIGLSFRRWQGRARRGWLGFLASSVAVVTGIALALQPLTAAPVQDNSGPNLLIIGIDALRQDRLSFFGHDRPTSPNIDGFLAEAAIFEQAFTQLPRTYPAWTTMLTGTWPTTHGIRDNLPTDDAIVPPFAFLSQVMADKGWATGFATDDSRFSYMVPETGFQLIRQPVVGLQNFAISVNEPRFRVYHALMHNWLGYALVPVQAFNQSFGKSYRPEHFAEYAVDALAEMSRSDKFFYAVHSCVLHVPGDRIYPWNRMFGQRGYYGANRFRYSSSGTNLIPAEVAPKKLEKAQKVAEQDARIYDSGVAMADQLVGRVMDSLRESGLIDNTIVVLVSDHGEELWDTDLPYKWYGPNHGFHVYGEGHLNVLMAVRFPDGRFAGQRFDNPVRLIDLAPTMAELFDLEWPNAVDGQSVMPIVNGTESGDRPVYVETGLSEKRYWVPGHRKYTFKRVSQRYSVAPETGRIHIRPKFRRQLIQGKDRAYQEGRWKLVWHSLKKGIRVELFDRETDPANRIDLSEVYPEKVEALARGMRPFLEADKIPSPRPSNWVKKSRWAKRKDPKWWDRMQRLGGTLPPGTHTPTAEEAPSAPEDGEQPTP